MGIGLPRLVVDRNSGSPGLIPEGVPQTSSRLSIVANFRNPWKCRIKMLHVLNVCPMDSTASLKSASDIALCILLHRLYLGSLLDLNP
jgi:hypothetical protein